MAIGPFRIPRPRRPVAGHAHGKDDHGKAMPGSAHPTRVTLDELLALAVLARGSSLVPVRRVAVSRNGGHASRWRGRGVDFRESRIYQPGDEIRHMDWRVTARSGKPHTKLFQEEREQSVLFAVDCAPSMRFGTRVRFKSVQAARAVALLAWVTTAAGDRVGAQGFGGAVRAEVRPAGGRRGALRVLRALRDWDAIADADAGEPLSASLARTTRVLRPGARLIIVTDGFGTDADAIGRLRQLASRHEVAVVLVRDPLELAPPPPGRYAVRSGSVRRFFDFADERTRSAWTERFAARRQDLAAACAQLGVRVVPLDVDADLRTALAPLLARMPRARSAA